MFALAYLFGMGFMIHLNIESTSYFIVSLFCHGFFHLTFNHKRVQQC
jgi:hypothetical protein